MKNLLLLFTMVLSIFSCTKESDVGKMDILYNNRAQTFFANIDCDDEIVANIGFALGSFIDEMLKHGEESFNARVNYFNENNNDLTYSEIVELTSSVFEMNEEIVHNYYKTIYSNAEYISLPENREKIEHSIKCYAESTSGEIESRWLFTTIANIAGASDCGFWRLAAGVADTAILGAATVAGGGPITGIGAASAYANTLNTALNC